MHGAAAIPRKHMSAAGLASLGLRWPHDFLVVSMPHASLSGDMKMRALLVRCHGHDFGKKQCRLSPL